MTRPPANALNERPSSSSQAMTVFQGSRERGHAREQISQVAGAHDSGPAWISTLGDGACVFHARTAYERPTTAAVCRAIIRSSSVGTTRTVHAADGRLTTSAFASFFAWSSSMPR